MKNLYFLGLVACAIIFSGCSGSKTDNKMQDSIAATDTGLLADKNYVFKNLTSTIFKSDFKFLDAALYTDSTHKTRFVELTKAQKVKLLAASMKKETGVNPDYVRDMMNAYFIAKQNKIGDLQPIIVQVSGDDYGALKMILLDKNNVVVNAFNICGGMDGGPSTIGDSLTEYEVKNYATIKENVILNTRISNSDFADSLKKPSYVDSEVYKIVIDRSGKTHTKQTVGIEYRRPYKP